MSSHVFAIAQYKNFVDLWPLQKVADKFDSLPVDYL